ncbi:MAG: YggS family pyridoxal phosphate-dependent enzyme [Chloroflexota bacterium]|nr:YggS family pyridoxal phosphate-dependent enzyme [Chloroflexota bacterium]
MINIEENIRSILETLPPDVTLVAAAKTRTLEEVDAAIQAGVTHIGYNYIQEALPIIQTIGDRVVWHMIGHLQRNKAKAAVQYFDMIETVDSWRLAETLDRRCANLGKTIPVLVEINSGREAGKTGVLPEEVDDLVRRLSQLSHIQVQGLMTMGPRFGDPEDARPYFRATREAFERLAALNLPNITMRTLSMGMSNSYLIAIEEGSTMVRIGTQIFGSREEEK